MMRVRGTLTPATEEKRLDHEDMVAMAAAVLPTSHREKFKDNHEVDLAYSVAGLGRFRCNSFQQRGTIGMIFRVIPMRVATIDELALPKVLKKIAAEERGLVLVTGTTGSGKTTTLAAMIDDINATRTAHVMTIEEPVDHQPARDWRRHQLVHTRAAQRPPAGPGRHPRRRNARLRDHRDGAAGGGNGPPGLFDAPHPRRDGNHQPHHCRLPAAPVEAD